MDAVLVETRSRRRCHRIAPEEQGKRNLGQMHGCWAEAVAGMTLGLAQREPKTLADRSIQAWPAAPGHVPAIEGICATFANLTRVPVNFGAWPQLGPSCST